MRIVILCLISAIFLSSSCDHQDLATMRTQAARDHSEQNLNFVETDADAINDLTSIPNNHRHPPAPTPRPHDTHEFNHPPSTYATLATAFTKINDIMLEPNTTATLFKLKLIASPTAQYHRELTSLIRSVNNTDMDHVRMLMNAIYFSFADYEFILGESARLRDAGAADSKLAKKLEADATIALALAPTAAQIANAGFVRAIDLDFDQGISALELLFPVGGAEQAFDALITKASPLRLDQKETLMLLASRKHEGHVAARIALDLFKHTTDQSPRSLLTIVDRLSSSARDFTLIASAIQFAQLSHHEVMELLSRQYGKDGSVAEALYARSTEKSHSHVLEIAETLNASGKAYFIEGALTYYSSITTEQIDQLCKHAKDICSHIIVAAKDKWQNPDPKSAVNLAKAIDYEERDEWLESVIGHFQKLTPIEAQKLLLTAYEGGPIACALADKIADLTIDVAIALANHLRYEDKDAWLLASIPHIQSPAGNELKGFVAAGYQDKLQLAQEIFPKVKVKNVTHAVEVANALYYDDRDEWIDFALNFFEQLSAHDFYHALKSAFAKKESIGEKYVNRVSDLRVENIISIARNVFTYGGTDTWLDAALPHLKSLTTSELKTLLKSVYDGKLEIAMKLADRISDLNAQNAASIATDIFYNDSRDTWLNHAVQRISSCTSKEAISLINASYLMESKLVIQIIAKISDFTVANAITVAASLRHDARDDFLLAAVDAVSDLTSTNLESLAASAFISKDKVREKALNRLNATRTRDDGHAEDFTNRG